MTKYWRGHYISCTPKQNIGGHVLPVPRVSAPMLNHTKLHSPIYAAEMETWSRGSNNKDLGYMTYRCGASERTPLGITQESKFPDSFHASLILRKRIIAGVCRWVRSPARRLMTSLWWSVLSSKSDFRPASRFIDDRQTTTGSRGCPGAINRTVWRPVIRGYSVHFTTGRSASTLWRRLCQPARCLVTVSQRSRGLLNPLEVVTIYIRWSVAVDLQW